jgi:hypothetical protein
MGLPIAQHRIRQRRIKPMPLFRSRLLSPFPLAALFVACSLLSADSRWALDKDGGITWTVSPGNAHQDQIEMSGRKVSVILTYGVDEDGTVALTRQVVFPSLRTIPNDTHASLTYKFAADATPRFFIDGRPVSSETATLVHIRGLVAIESVLGKRKEIELRRVIFPSTTRPLVLERYTFTNRSAQAVSVEAEDTLKTVRTSASRGVAGEYVITAQVIDAGQKTMKPGESVSFALAFTAREAGASPMVVNAAQEEQARRDRVDEFLSKLQLETPDPVLNTAFAFAKIRATESIYETKGGLMHGPGGGSYYAAIWANDQAEYANPFFPYLGDPAGNESAVNAYHLFARYMNPEYKPIPSSIVAEGTGEWHGAGDRGDMAMIAYGASRFALAYGRKDAAEDLWTLITWCLEYCRGKVNAQGVVESNSDELEGRFPSGKANLCTSSLYYDALNSAVFLGRALGKPIAELNDYQERAKAMRAAIESYFSATVEGFETYRYYEGNTVLRAWICIPLTVGIYDRALGTIAALFSPRLWTQDGLATQAGERTFWDRSTLYALRGVLAAGDTDRAMPFLTYYSNRRLLGEHVPYPVEAYPEGNQRHLAAESALYCRIYTEGLFGMRPTGLHSFRITPRLPNGWDTMRLNKIQAYGKDFDVVVTRAGDKLKVETSAGGKVLNAKVLGEGESADVELGGL